jgi:annexin A7/11/annexin A13
MGLNIYPPTVHEGDLTPDFGPEIEALCQEIHDACKGFGTDEK